MLLNLLTHVMNLSLSEGIVHIELKLAHVIPLYENYDNMLINNYGPVSILHLFSKFLERIMFTRYDIKSVFGL